MVQAVAESQGESVKEMMNKLAVLEALQRLSNQILERTEQKYLINVRYEWGSIKIKIIVVNKSDTEQQRVPVKSYLPQEVRPEHVTDRGDFDVVYDPEKQLYFVELPTTPTDRTPLIGPREMREYEITVADVWTILEEGDNGLKIREDVADEYFKKLKNKTEGYRVGTDLLRKISEVLNDIRLLQNAKSRISVEKYISNYRDNKEKLATVDSYLDALRKLAYPELFSGESPLSLTDLTKLGVGKGAGEGDKTLGITAEKSWLVILIVLVFLGVLSVIFFFIWQSHLKKSRVSPELTGINPESVRMPYVGKSGEEKK
jgi:hypothetical protein